MGKQLSDIPINFIKFPFLTRKKSTERHPSEQVLAPLLAVCGEFSLKPREKKSPRVMPRMNPRDIRVNVRGI